MDEFEIPGYWWLPEDRGVKEIAGTLSFTDEDGLVLKLMGTLETKQVAYDQAKDHTPPLIQGLTEDSKEWTLAWCARSGFQISMPGYARETYRARAGYRGLRFGDPSAMVFDQVYLGLSRLPDWAGRTVWQEEMDFEKTESGKSRLTGMRVSYEQPETVAVTLEGHGAALELVHDMRMSGDRFRELSLTQDVAFRLTLDEPTTLDDIYERFVFPLQNLLTLATARPNAVTRLTLANDEYFLEAPSGDRTTQPADIYFSRTYVDRRDKALMNPWMLFTMRQLGAQFGDRVSTWLSVSSELATVCELVFGPQYSPPGLLEYRFLAMAQALEAYHRARIGGQDLEPEQHQARLESVLEETPGEWLEWLKCQLEFSNELSFRRRVRDVVSRLAPFSDFAGDTKRFADQITKTRNYLVHRTDDLRDGAAEGAELYRLTETLGYALKGSLMLEVGFGANEVAELFSDNQSFLQFRNHYYPDWRS